MSLSRILERLPEDVSDRKLVLSRLLETLYNPQTALPSELFPVKHKDVIQFMRHALVSTFPGSTVTTQPAIVIFKRHVAERDIKPEDDLFTVMCFYFSLYPEEFTESLSITEASDNLLLERLIAYGLPFFTASRQASIRRLCDLAESSSLHDRINFCLSIHAYCHLLPIDQLSIIVPLLIKNLTHRPDDIFPVAKKALVALRELGKFLTPTQCDEIALHLCPQINMILDHYDSRNAEQAQIYRQLIINVLKAILHFPHYTDRCLPVFNELFDRIHLLAFPAHQRAVELSDQKTASDIRMSFIPIKQVFMDNDDTCTTLWGSKKMSVFVKQFSLDVTELKACNHSTIKVKKKYEELARPDMGGAPHSGTNAYLASLNSLREAAKKLILDHTPDHEKNECLNMLLQFTRHIVNADSWSLDTPTKRTLCNGMAAALAYYCSAPQSVKDSEVFLKILANTLYYLQESMEHLSVHRYTPLLDNLLSLLMQFKSGRLQNLGALQYFLDDAQQSVDIHQLIPAILGISPANWRATQHTMLSYALSRIQEAEQCAFYSALTEQAATLPQALLLRLIAYFEPAPHQGCCQLNMLARLAPHLDKDAFRELSHRLFERLKHPVEHQTYFSNVWTPDVSALFKVIPEDDILTFIGEYSGELDSEDAIVNYQNYCVIANLHSLLSYQEQFLLLCSLSLNPDIKQAFVFLDVYNDHHAHLARALQRHPGLHFAQEHRPGM